MSCMPESRNEPSIVRGGMPSSKRGHASLSPFVDFTVAPAISSAVVQPGLSIYAQSLSDRNSPNYQGFIQPPGDAIQTSLY